VKVLLINANTFKQPWPVIPFGLCCVAAYLEQAGYHVEVLDLCFAKDPPAAIRAAIADISPNVIGISVRNIDNSVGFNTEFLLERTKGQVIDPCKEAFDGPIVIGGPAVGINGREILEYFDLPFAIAGDGEHAMVAFLRNLQDQGPMEKTPGLIWRMPEGLLVENPPCRVPDLNTLPLADPSRYINLRPYLRHNSPLQVQTKRGCALRCVYCTYNRIEGQAYRLKSPEKVADEIAMLVKRTGIRTVEFTDSTFNIPSAHAKAVLKALIARRLSLQLRTMGLNPGAVDAELVDLMKRAGFTEVDVGAESGCDRMLKALGKNFTKRDIFKTGELLRKASIPATWYLLLGAPGETVDTLRETFETMDQVASPWDLVNVAVGMRVYRGSPLGDTIRDRHPETAAATRNFLFPAQLPESYAVDVKTIKDKTKRQALKKPNYYMYDEDEKTPLWVLRTVSAIIRHLQLKQPLWRSFILLRKIEKFVGYSTLRRFHYERQRTASAKCP